jgi:hypothetical protein
MLSLSIASRQYSNIGCWYAFRMFCIFSGVLKTWRNELCVASTTDRSLSYSPHNHAATLCGIYLAIFLPDEAAIWPCSKWAFWRTALELSIDVRG